MDNSGRASAGHYNGPMDEQTQTLIRSLRDDPEARDALLRELLPDRFLDLPARFEVFEQTLQQLIEAQTHTQQQLDVLTQRVDALAEAQGKTEIAVQTLADRFSKHLPRIDMAVGYVVERRYQERASAYFAPIAGRIRVLDRQARDDLVDQALDDGNLTRSEATALRLADTIARGRRNGEPVYLVVEASYTVDEGDVDRAASRAGLLGRLVGATIPIVAGEYVDEDARLKAEEKGVWRVLDGTVTGPDGLTVS